MALEYCSHRPCYCQWGKSSGHSLPGHSLKFQPFRFHRQLVPTHASLCTAVLNEFKIWSLGTESITKNMRTLLPFINACATLKKRLFSTIVDLNKLLRATNIARHDNPNTLHNTIFFWEKFWFGKFSQWIYTISNDWTDRTSYSNRQFISNEFLKSKIFKWNNPSTVFW